MSISDQKDDILKVYFFFKKLALKQTSNIYEWFITYRKTPVFVSAFNL